MAESETAVKKYSVEFSSFFFNDLSDAINYLSGYSESASERFKTLLFKRIEDVKSMPKMYAVYPFAKEYRYITVDKYVAVYRLHDENQIIFMYRLLHGSRDIPNYL